MRAANFAYVGCALAAVVAAVFFSSPDGLADQAIHTTILPVFERFLIFNTPPAIFTESTTVTVQLINLYVSLTNNLFGRVPSSSDDVILLVGGGVKSGCFVSSKLTLEIAMHYRKPFLIDDFVHRFYDDPWSESGNFKFADPPPASTVLRDSHLGKIIHNGCQPTQKVITSSEIRSHQDVRCVWFLRDPLARLLSFYTYTLDAGEYQLRNASAYARSLTLPDGLRWVFETFARDVIREQDTSYVDNFKTTYNCTEIYMNDLKRDFDGSMRRMLHGLDLISESSLSNSSLMDRLRKHDLSRSNVPHPHASRASKHFKRLVRLAIEDDPEIWAFVNASRNLLGITPGS